MKIFRRTANAFFKSNSIFKCKTEAHLAFLKRLPKPKNPIQRSYNQFKCQCYQKSFLSNLKNSFIALFLIPPLIIYLLIKPGRRRRGDSTTGSNQAVFIFIGVSDIIPLCLKKRYQTIAEVSFGDKWYLNINDLKYLFFLKKYFLSPFFLLKLIYKLALYRAIISNWGPKAIICSSEYSFTSSFLTWYCEQNHIKHINVMHGEKLLNIRDSFFKFHECYVWDEHYLELFKTLRADEDQFIVATPPSLLINDDSDSEQKYELTYYLGGEKAPEMERIKEILLKINIPVFRICIRPHPRYSDLNKVSSIFQHFLIEDPMVVSMKQSFGNTRMVAALYSTILFQGFLSGKQIVLDDLSQKDKFDMLKEMKYIMFSKNYRTISSLL